MKQSKVQFEPTDGTLAELREIVEATAHLPGETEVRIQVRIGIGADGTAAKKITMLPATR
jgi:hypothetical protein